MKKFLSLFLAMVLVLSAFIAAPNELPGLVVSAGAEETITEETTNLPETTEPETTEPVTPAESFLEFELSSDGKSYVVSEYNGEYAEQLVIPSEYDGKPVTAIGRGAFSHSNKISCVVIPDSVSRIEPYAFCYSTLKEVQLGEGVTYIGSQAFDTCTALEKIELPNSLKEIGRNAFSDCKLLEEITIPGNVSKIDNYAFAYCTSLKKVVFLEGASGLDYFAFKDCPNIEEVVLPEKNQIKLYASDFKGSKIYKDKANWYADSFYIGTTLINTTAYIHGTRAVRPGTTHLNPGAFSGVNNLVAVTLPETVRYIGNDAFKSDSLAVIYYEGTQTEFNKIDLANNASHIKNNMVVSCGMNKSKIPQTPKVKALTNVVGGVQITWNKVSNADLYVVYRRGANTERWTALGFTTGTSVVDTTAGHRQYWRYSIQALNDNGVSKFDSTGKYTKYVETPHLTGLYNKSNGLELTWNPVSGASGYRVYRRAANQSWVYLGTVKGTAYLDKAVNTHGGKYYRYTVRAVVDGRYSSFEDYLYTMRLGTPQGLSAKSDKYLNLTIKWKSVTGATGYYVYAYDHTRYGWVQIGYVKGGKNTSFATTASAMYNNYTVVAANGKYRSEFNTKGIK